MRVDRYHDDLRITLRQWLYSVHGSIPAYEHIAFRDDVVRAGETTSEMPTPYYRARTKTLCERIIAISGLDGGIHYGHICPRCKKIAEQIAVA